MKERRWHKAVNILLALALTLASFFTFETRTEAGGNISITRIFQYAGSESYVDSMVNQASPTTNYGTNTTMEVKSRTSQNECSLVQLDISQLASGSAVSSSTLSLYLVTTPTQSQTHSAYRIIAYVKA